MTKESTPHEEKAPATNPEPAAPAVNAPYDAPKRYETFYLVLLILSSISTGLGIFGLFSLGELPTYLSSSLVYAIGLIISIVAWLISAIALALLWMKHPLGIWTKLGSYGLSIAGTILAIVGAGPIIKDSTAQAVAESAKSNTEVDADMVEAFVAGGIYVVLSVTILFNIIFAILWYIAWKKQHAADVENKLAS